MSMCTENVCYLHVVLHACSVIRAGAPILHGSSMMNQCTPALVFVYYLVHALQHVQTFCARFVGHIIAYLASCSYVRVVSVAHTNI